MLFIEVNTSIRSTPRVMLCAASLFRQVRICELFMFLKLLNVCLNKLVLLSGEQAKPVLGFLRNFQELINPH